MHWYRHTCKPGDSLNGLGDLSTTIFRKENDRLAAERILKENASFKKLGGFITYEKLERGVARLGTDVKGNAMIVFRAKYEIPLR